MPDFGLAQVPNFAASALGGFQAGQAMGRQQLVQSALSGIDLSRPETITPLLKADPEHGIALLGASSKLLEHERAIAGRQAATDYLTTRFAPKPATSSVSTTGTTSATAGPAGHVAAPGASADASSAEHRLMQADPQGYLTLRESIDKMDETQRKRVIDGQDALHQLAVATAGLPYEQRKAYIASHAQDLAQHYVTPDQIAGFDPTDQNLGVITQQVLGVKGVAEAAEKRAALAEAQRHNRVSEGQGATRIGIAQQALSKRGAGGAAAGTGDLSDRDNSELFAVAGIN